MSILLIALATALPLPNNGPCPNGYSSSAKFCLPNKDAGVAVPVDHMESCPNGMSRSGITASQGPHVRMAQMKTPEKPMNPSSRTPLPKVLKLDKVWQDVTLQETGKITGIVGLNIPAIKSMPATKKDV